MQCIIFSPTNTTRTIVRHIASTLADEPATIIDLTLPEKREPLSGQGPVIIGMPVYGGRIPALAIQRLRALGTGQGRPAIVVVVYGNRAFDDALLELRDLALELGFIPVAGAAFVGEHSFSTPTHPIGAGRPDEQDLTAAQDFGRAVRQKLAQHPDLSTCPKLEVPGNFPYREGIAAAPIAPETLTENCVLCGECALVCPTQCITITESEVETDKTNCLRCCACIRVCAYGARVMLEPKMVEFARNLHKKFQRRAEPEVFL